jgi:murein DD-endopeptidase MepM/ murein hydrolase activator NlpD
VVLLNRTFNPTTGLLTGLTVLVLSSCGTYTSAIKSEQPIVAQVAEEPAFIEDFWTDSARTLITPRLENPVLAETGLRSVMHNSAANQLPMSEELAQLGENARLQAEALGDNIGGIDFANPEEAEHFEMYDELFLANELNAGEVFDPSKMTDSIPVYLVSPWSNCYVFPLDQSKVNSDFGWRHSRFHSGIDLDLEVGDDVFASFDGIVKKSDYVSGYGNLVVVKHFNGLETYYAHLSKILVAEGDTVNAGEKIALGGNTGRSTGPHLHYEIRYRGAAINPKYLVDFKNEVLVSESFYLKREHFKPTTESGSTATTTGKKYVTVKSGDTLSKIAQRNHTTVSKICKLNNISAKKILRPGQRLRVK